MIRITALLLGALLAGSCSHKVEDIDPNDPENINLAFGFDDLKTIATDMTQSFLDSNRWGGDRPRILFGGIKNRTQQHIDTVNITDTIRTALIQSGKFTVLAGNEGIAEIDQEVAYQQSGAVDLASAAELGKQLGAEYVFYGRFTEIRKQRSDTTAAWYKFTMNAVNVQTREIVWAEEQDIAKKETKAFIGW
ncbi:MAG: penicillin-binding protein activator LpoB [Planctomycetes bacterium]|nr:penicillin-binding protein activator LpoB [Planctomycetota bacterium]